MITEHFKERLKQRTRYNDVETFWNDVKKKKEDVVRLTKGCFELNEFPRFKRKLQRNPLSQIWVIKEMKLCLVTENNNLITIFKL